jgi:hypothetical protein
MKKAMHFSGIQHHIATNITEIAPINDPWNVQNAPKH